MTRVVVGWVGLVGYGIAAVIALFFPIYGGRGATVLVDAVLGFFERVTAPLGLGIVGVEMLANVLVFVPIGVFAAMILPRAGWWIAVIGGAVLSMSAELFQDAVLSSRVGSVRDVILNIAGTFIGAFGTWVVRRIAAARVDRNAAPH